MKPVFTYEQIAYQLTDAGQAFFGESRQSFNVPSSKTLFYDASDLNEAGRIFTRAAFDTWTAVSGINFVESFFLADIVLNDGFGGEQAFAETVTNAAGDIIFAEVTITRDWIRDDWTRTATGQVVVDFDSYSMQTFVHEIGHALGLAHAGDYNGNASFQADAHYANDSWQTTIMSYFPQDENPNVDADFAYIMTPMIADIIAIQDLYGIRPSAFVGDTIYGFNGNTGSYLDDLVDADNPIAFTIYDSLGNDTVDVSGFTMNQSIDLRPEVFSDVAGLRGNMVIAPFVEIENAIAGAGDDTVQGNDFANVLSGNAGDDRIDGGLGNDQIQGGLDNDHLSGDGGRDTLQSFAGVNTMNGGADDDQLFGGFQADALFGGAGNDALRGDMGNGFLSGSDTLDGGTGDDVLMGAGGADTFIFRPGDGSDTIGRFDPTGTTALPITVLGADFTTGQDKIALDGFTGVSASNVMSFVSDTGNGAAFQAQGTQITFFDLGRGALSADDFIFL